jgi:hypothetical protein
LTAVLDGEARPIRLIGLEQGKKPAFPDPEDLLDVRSFDFVVKITLKHFFDLTVGELLVQLGHNQNLPFWSRLWLSKEFTFKL